MTNLEKMNEIVGTAATKEQVVQWAYMNRIHVLNLDLEPEFECMKKSVENFYNNTEVFSADEFKNWDNFLLSEYAE